MQISADVLSTFDPAIKSLYVQHGILNILLHQNTVVLTFKEYELDRLIKYLQEMKNGL